MALAKMKSFSQVTAFYVVFCLQNSEFYIILPCPVSSLCLFRSPINIENKLLLVDIPIKNDHGLACFTVMRNVTPFVMVVYRIAFIRQSEAKFVICLSKWSKAYREKQRRLSKAEGVAPEAFPSYKIWLSHENIRVATDEEVMLRLR